MSDLLDEISDYKHPPFERAGARIIVSEKYLNGLISRYAKYKTRYEALLLAAVGVALACTCVAIAASHADTYSYSKTLPDKGRVWTVILRHVDGDTVQLGSIVDEGTARLLDIDAPEIRGKTQAERDAAQASKKRLAELLPINSVWRTEVQGHDGFDRPLVRFVREDGGTVNRQMIDEGHAKLFKR